jgi:glycosyltransferase involved in cell wall biosynthesis
VNEVWPSITAKLGSHVRLLVAGHASEPIRRALESDSVQFLGPVPDLRSVYEQARVFVAANRVSYGVPIKVLEAAAYGVPVVTTDEVNSYLGWRGGVDILCSDEPLAFARACMQLHEDPDLWRQIRAEALKRVDQQEERKKFLGLMDGLTA